MDKLTERQNDTLNSIKKFIAKNGYAPTVREICKDLNLNSPATVQTHLNKLAEKGYIEKGTEKNRTIKLQVPNEYSNSGIISIPLIGKVTAGNPITAIERPDEYMEIPVSMIPKGHEVFALDVEGESMIKAGIYDGDTIIVETSNTARNGEIVVAMTEDDEATVKRFYKENNHFRLQPENDTMSPIILDKVTILGKVIGLYRKMK